MTHNYLYPQWVELAASVRLDQDNNRIDAVKGICDDIHADLIRYQKVSDLTGVPAILIAAIHYRESSRNFKCMMHNGEPLNRKSRIVPIGVGPFDTWEASAVDALVREGCKEIVQWEMADCLEFAEKYNGKGYRKRGMYSPYVFAFTNMSDELGGYPSDGKFSMDYVHKRPGVAAILLGMINKYGA